MTSRAMVDDDLAFDATEAIDVVDAAGDAAGEMLMLTAGQLSARSVDFSDLKSNAKCHYEARFSTRLLILHP